MEHTANRSQSAYGKVFAVCVFPYFFFFVFVLEMYIKFCPTNTHSHRQRTISRHEYIGEYSNATEKSMKWKLCVQCLLFAPLYFMWTAPWILGLIEIEWNFFYFSICKHPQLVAQNGARKNRNYVYFSVQLLPASSRASNSFSLQRIYYRIVHPNVEALLYITISIAFASGIMFIHSIFFLQEIRSWIKKTLHLKMEKAVRERTHSRKLL